MGFAMLQSIFLLSIALTSASAYDTALHSSEFHPSGRILYTVPANSCLITARNATDGTLMWERQACASSSPPSESFVMNVNAVYGDLHTLDSTTNSSSVLRGWDGVTGKLKFSLDTGFGTTSGTQSVFSLGDFIAVISGDANHFKIWNNQGMVVKVEGSDTTAAPNLKLQGKLAGNANKMVSFHVSPEVEMDDSGIDFIAIAVRTQKKIGKEEVVTDASVLAFSVDGESSTSTRECDATGLLPTTLSIRHSSSIPLPAKLLRSSLQYAMILPLPYEKESYQHVQRGLVGISEDRSKIHTMPLLCPELEPQTFDTNDVYPNLDVEDVKFEDLGIMALDIRKPQGEQALFQVNFSLIMDTEATPTKREMGAAYLGLHSKNSFNTNGGFNFKSFNGPDKTNEDEPAFETTSITLGGCIDTGTALFYAVSTPTEVWVHTSVVTQNQGLSRYSSKKIEELVPGTRIERLVPNCVAHDGTALLVAENGMVVMAHMNDEIKWSQEECVA